MSDAKQRCGVFVLGVVLAVWASAPTWAAVPSFQGLGDLPGGTFASRARGISADGQVVVGESTSASGSEAFRWMPTDGMVGLGSLGGPTFMSRAHAASADGSVIVGESISPSGTEAFRWTAAGGMAGLGDFAGGNFSSTAQGVSADGSVVVGTGRESVSTTARAFHWTASGGMVPLYFSGPEGTRAFGVSADGGTIVGDRAFGPVSGAPAYWSGGPWFLDLPGATSNQWAGGTVNAISADGEVVVGGRSFDFAQSRPAFRWHVGTPEIIALGSFPDESIIGSATAVSSDGSVIVGWSGVPPLFAPAIGSDAAFIWDQSNGMRRLSGVLSGLGLNVDGWNLWEASGISADGRVIVGYGTNPLGQTEAWIAVIPEPAALSLLALAGVLVGAGGRRRRRRIN